MYTPIYLGSFDLARPLDYIDYIPIMHLMVLMFRGYSLNHIRTLPDVARASAIEGLRAIYGLAILHGDMARRNMLWNPKE